MKPLPHALSHPFICSTRLDSSTGRRSTAAEARAPMRTGARRTKGGGPEPRAGADRRRRISAIHCPTAGAIGPITAGEGPEGAVYTPTAEQQRHALRAARRACSAGSGRLCARRRAAARPRSPLASLMLSDRPGVSGRATRAARAASSAARLRRTQLSGGARRRLRVRQRVEHRGAMCAQHVWITAAPYRGARRPPSSTSRAARCTRWRALRLCAFANLRLFPPARRGAQAGGRARGFGERVRACAPPTSPSPPSLRWRAVPGPLEWPSPRTSRPRPRCSR